ncbi:hypothetical protein [Haloterrigena alkaliphila]|uniref:DUF8142 domain-containing protein n=1 Tax=Haloterrigena alkaliphila TaxID=2816475 RepID=A0A8A2VAE8_9EURY|nr:hypothetical protein [Haloterrigena alkaliphila]QSW99019.1 hypothetical protein J0X25_16795 [Haloterrigena alkaliphila]
MEPTVPGDDSLNRRRAALYVAPFLAIGVLNLVLLLGWGLDPLWAFAILPPILAISAIAWVAFSHGFDVQSQRSGGRRD